MYVKNIIILLAEHGFTCLLAVIPLETTLIVQYVHHSLVRVFSHIVEGNPHLKVNQTLV